MQTFGDIVFGKLTSKYLEIGVDVRLFRKFTGLDGLFPKIETKAHRILRGESTAKKTSLSTDTAPSPFYCGPPHIGMSVSMDSELPSAVDPRLFSVQLEKTLFRRFLVVFPSIALLFFLPLPHRNSQFVARLHYWPQLRELCPYVQRYRMFVHCQHRAR